MVQVVCVLSELACKLLGERFVFRIGQVPRWLSAWERGKEYTGILCMIYYIKPGIMKKDFFFACLCVCTSFLPFRLNNVSEKGMGITSTVQSWFPYIDLHKVKYF